MYDSTTPAAIPADAQMVALYPHAWNADFSKFPNAAHVLIDNRGDHADDCHVLDVEAGAASAATAREWVASWWKLHPNGMTTNGYHFSKPTLYYSLSRDTEIRAALAPESFNVWIAHWDGVASIVPNTVAKQYASDTMLHVDYDKSDVYDDTWAVHLSAPTPPPVPAPASPAMGWLVTNFGGNLLARQVHSTDGGTHWA
jgi:hypothetical protein